ncbi:DUF4112 domain-containing protein [Roseovarius sp. 2305UL8-3]|uniref:DUF4112 domain-containing protein n=1 Tax=Roseovarius conchicola TaxID=3121636 RepID=UPI003528D9DF
MPSDFLKSVNTRVRVERLETLAGALDSRFRIFGISLGWDSLLGLIPGVGAAATAIPGALMIAEGARMGARKRVLARMGVITGVDMLMGAIPIVGDAFDIFFKSHQRNVALLKVEIMRREIEEDVRQDDPGNACPLPAQML